MLSKEIQNKVQNLWDRLWSGGFANPISAIEQISYLLCVVFSILWTKKYRNGPLETLMRKVSG